MGEKRLIINTGSASKKYALFDGEAELFRMHMETEGGNLVAGFKFGNGGEEKETISKEQYDSSIAYVLDLLVARKLIGGYADIAAVGLRIVAPGAYFLSNRGIDAEYLSELDRAKEEAPLHIGPVISEIEQLRRVMPEVKMAGISDSSFHSTMPDVARVYGLPRGDAEKYGIYRYGYHGISARSVLRKLGTMGGVPPRVIICHLGGGVSITAVKDGKSADTSMGFSPSEGVIMPTRVGNIDPGAVAYLAQKLGLGLGELESFFNTKCGLLGISGRSDDIRELLELEKQGDTNARLALDAFAYQVKKYIGSYFAVLGGMDLLVFTATIGERSFVMRSRICKGLEALGAVIDEEKNAAAVSADGFINSDSSAARIAVVAIDEMKEIAEEMQVL